MLLHCHHTALRSSKAAILRQALIHLSTLLHKKIPANHLSSILRQSANTPLSVIHSPAMVLTTFVACCITQSDRSTSTNTPSTTIPHIWQTDYHDLDLPDPISTDMRYCVTASSYRSCPRKTCAQEPWHTGPIQQNIIWILQIIKVRKVIYAPKNLPGTDL